MLTEQPRGRRKTTQPFMSCREMLFFCSRRITVITDACHSVDGGGGGTLSAGLSVHTLTLCTFSRKALLWIYHFANRPTQTEDALTIPPKGFKHPLKYIFSSLIFCSKHSSMQLPSRLTLFKVKRCERFFKAPLISTTPWLQHFKKNIFQSTNVFAENSVSSAPPWIPHFH